jgi:hypothetical protein
MFYFLKQTNIDFSTRSIDDPSVKLDNTCKTGFYELKKHREMKRRQKHEMGAEAYRHYKWVSFKISCKNNVIKKTGKTSPP